MTSNNIRTKSNTKQQLKLNKSLLNELPHYQLTGSLALTHGQFNNSLNSKLLTKRDIEKLPSLYDLDLFSLNRIHDNHPTVDDILLNQCFPASRGSFPGVRWREKRDFCDGSEMALI